MKLSVFFDHILEAEEQTGKPLAELLTEGRQSGIEAVEINLQCLREHPEYKELLQKADLKVSCIYEFYEMGIRDESGKVKLHIEAAVEVGADRVLIVPGFLHGFEAWLMQWYLKHPKKLARWFSRNAHIQSMVQGLKDIVMYGAQKGITVTVEDFDDIHSPLSGVHGVQWFLQQVPKLGYTLDTGNFLFYGDDVLKAYELLKDRVAHVHCKDRAFGNNASVQTGSGRMPIKQIVEALKVQGYEGYLAIEHFGADGQAICMAGSALYLRGMM